MSNQPDFDYEAALYACVQGKEQALQQLYQQESRRLLGVVMRIVRQRDIAEDVVHDAFVTIWTQAAQFDAARGSARGWIYSIARHKALNKVRNDLRQVSMDEEQLEALEQTNMQADVSEGYMLNAELGRLHDCLGHLDVAKRTSILFAYVDGCSHGEIAERLNKPLGTIKAWIRRGLGALRECLA